MGFLLKIVEGPNKGAEVALVEGVAVTLGKGDDCDIVLADTTLPDSPVAIEASEAAVTLDGERIEPLHVRTLGATSLAVGPADSAWGELVWPQKEDKGRNAGDEGREDDGPSQAASPAPPPEEPPAEKAPAEKKRRRGLAGCLVVVLLAAIVLAAVWWFFGGRIVEFVERRANAAKEVVVPKATLADVADKYSLDVEQRDGRDVLVGNLKTRAERLAATAEAYEARPGVEVDLSDDESFRASAVDALFTLTEGSIEVVAATNRVVELSGLSRSPASLERVLKALNADLPKMRGFDVSRVKFSGAVADVVGEQAGQGGEPLGLSTSTQSGGARKSAPSLNFPVCGILMTPYPCLVMRNGSRVLEGASVGESVILKIEADAVTVSNSMGVVTWKP